MKYIFITLIFNFLLIYAYSQNEKVVIKFCPLALVDEVTFPTIQGGVEFKLKSGISLYNELGIKYRTGYYESYDTNFINSYGFKFKFEVRFYLTKIFKYVNPDGVLKGLYVGGNLFFIRDYHNSKIGYFFEKDSSTLLSDNFVVKKNIIGTNIILGLQKQISRKFLIDFYAGLGLRIRIIENLYREYDSDRD